MLQISFEGVKSQNELLERILALFEENSQAQQEAKAVFLDLWAQLVTITAEREVLGASIKSSLVMYFLLIMSKIASDNLWINMLFGMAGIVIGRYIHEQAYGTDAYFQAVLKDPVTQRVLTDLQASHSADDLLARIRKQKTTTYLNYLHARSVTVATTVGGGLAALTPVGDQAANMMLGELFVWVIDTILREQVLPNEYSQFSTRQPRPQ